MTPADWRQINIDFPDRAAAAGIAADDLRPALEAAREAGLLHGWWFVRKKPWRLRYRAADPEPAPIAQALNQLAGEGRISSWAQGIYEPEIRAFGGEAAMDIAHELFHRDSQHILARVARHQVPAMGQRETTALLCSTMFRAAGLDWYEQGDVWARVAELRPARPESLAPERARELARAMRRLMTADIRTLPDPGDRSQLADPGAWLAAFTQAGQALADLSHCGQLRRGLRDVLAHHVIFHANRAGISTAHQSVLAMLASGTVFTPDGDAPLSAVTSTTRDFQMTAAQDATPAVSDAQLRSELADRLCRAGMLRSAAAEHAFRTTPRHLFLPGIPLPEAYADTPVYTKHDRSGVSVSAASQPWMVAMMAGQLAAQPGDRILEIGAGTGYNAAIIAAITGDTGKVTTIDMDEDLVTGARQHLAATGAGNVDVVLGDGALGHPDGAPFDRIIATAGVYEIPGAWLDQLAPAGRLVVPLRLRGTISRSIIFERDGQGWRSRGSQLAVFMPLRGIGDDARRYLPLTPDGEVTLQVHKDQEADPGLLAGALDTSRGEEWTGTVFPPEVPYEWLELWLSLRLDNALMRMNVQPSAADRGLVTPMFPWGSMATTSGASLAYLTTRPARPGPDGQKRYEVGVIGHGPGGAALARQAAEYVRAWDQGYRHRSARFEIPGKPATTDPDAGRFALNRPRHPLTVIWE